MKFGIDRLLADPALRAPLEGKRVALLAHPASVTADLTHSLDALVGVRRSTSPPPSARSTACAATSRTIWSNRRISPIRSTASRCSASTARCAGRPASRWGRSTRSWSTSRTSAAGSTPSSPRLRYVLEAAAEHGKSVWVLDRPNPAGRPVEGLTLARGLGELRRRRPDADAPRPDARRAGRAGSSTTLKLDVDYRVIEMEGYEPDAAPGFGWPLGERIWVNPSPNAPNLYMARAYAGTVMLEGTTLSEGRGTTRPLELFGAPDIDARAVIAEMRALRAATGWRAARCARSAFEPTFHKHVGKLCTGVHIHAEGAALRPRTPSSPGGCRRWPSRRSAGSIPDYDLWRDFPYEYELGKLAIDVINGGPLLREWVDDPAAAPGDLDALTVAGRAGLGGRAAALSALLMTAQFTCSIGRSSAAYVGLLALAGILSTRRQRDAADYFLAGHRVPIWLVAVSVLPPPSRRRPSSARPITAIAATIPI